MVWQLSHPATDEPTLRTRPLSRLHPPRTSHPIWRRNNLQPFTAARGRHTRATRPTVAVETKRPRSRLPRSRSMSRTRRWHPIAVKHSPIPKKAAQRLNRILGRMGPRDGVAQMARPRRMGPRIVCRLPISVPMILSNHFRSPDLQRSSCQAKTGCAGTQSCEAPCRRSPANEEALGEAAPQVARPQGGAPTAGRGAVRHHHRKGQGLCAQA